MLKKYSSVLLALALAAVFVFGFALAAPMQVKATPIGYGCSCNPGDDCCANDCSVCTCNGAPSVPDDPRCYNFWYNVLGEMQEKGHTGLITRSIELSDSNAVHYVPGFILDTLRENTGLSIKVTHQDVTYRIDAGRIAQTEMLIGTNYSFANLLAIGKFT